MKKIADIYFDEIRKQGLQGIILNPSVDIRENQTVKDREGNYSCINIGNYTLTLGI